MAGLQDLIMNGGEMGMEQSMGPVGGKAMIEPTGHRADADSGNFDVHNLGRGKRTLPTPGDNTQETVLLSAKGLPVGGGGKARVTTTRSSIGVGDLFDPGLGPPPERAKPKLHPNMQTQEVEGAAKGKRVHESQRRSRDPTTLGGDTRTGKRYLVSAPPQHYNINTQAEVAETRYAPPRRHSAAADMQNSSEIFQNLVQSDLPAHRPGRSFAGSSGKNTRTANAEMTLEQEFGSHKTRKGVEENAAAAVLGEDNSYPGGSPRMLDRRPKRREVVPPSMQPIDESNPPPVVAKRPARQPIVPPFQQKADEEKRQYDEGTYTIPNHRRPVVPRFQRQRQRDEQRMRERMEARQAAEAEKAATARLPRVGAAAQRGWFAPQFAKKDDDDI